MVGNHLFLGLCEAPELGRLVYSVRAAIGLFAVSLYRRSKFSIIQTSEVKSNMAQMND